MILGYLLIGLALVATLGATVLFTKARRGGNYARLLRPARALAVTATAGVVGASVYLSYLLFTHQFQVAYVASFSARDQAAKYLFAAFWGGQEGSILLWAFWTSVMGALLAWRGGGREAKVWPIFGFVQLFLLGLLLIKSPFALGAGPVPRDGQGLNPLLQNYWMVIHPPVLFLGFASLVVPYAWTVYGLLFRDWDGWVKLAFPWTLFAFASLGFGVALGGYWAYETLGWGGFWAWDPVENTSIVPWLFVTALLHGFAIQRGNGGYKATNLFLGFLPFACMFYGTFLTRTGVLEGFSNHTFSSLGPDGYWLILSGVLTSALVPLALFVARVRSIPKPPAYERVVTREFGFFLASALLGIIGLITAVGMSAPILTRQLGRFVHGFMIEGKEPSWVHLWMEKGAAAQAGFYNQATFPLAILLLVGMAATPYFTWRATDADGVLKRLFPAYAVSIVLTLAMLLLGGRDPWMLLLFATGMFAALSNAVLLFPRLRKRESRRTVGGFVAHMGAGLALVGVACLVAFSRNERAMLVKDQPNDVMGYKMTYLGMTSQPFDRANQLRFKMERNGKTWETNSSLYFAPLGGKQELFANPPGINRYLWGDLYVAHYRGPFSGDEKSPNSGWQMEAQDERTFGDYKVKFWGIEWPDEVREAMKGDAGPAALEKLGDIRMTALVDVWYKGQKLEPKEGEPSSPAMIINPKTGASYSVPLILPGAKNAILTVDKFNPPQGAQFSTTNVPDLTEMVVMDVSTKPLIWMVWLGTLLYTLGGLVAYRRRAQDIGLIGDEPESTPARPEEAPAPAPQKRDKRRRTTGRPSPEPARAVSTPRRQ